MSAALILILAVAVAYLATHIAFDWLARRFLIVSGAEYLVLGILLGPQVSGVLSQQVVDGFAPLITLSLGWIGAIVGTQFYLPALVRVPATMYRIAFFEAITTALLVGGVSTVAVAWTMGIAYDVAAVPGAALGAIAAVSAPAGIALVVRELARRGPIVRQLEIVTAIDALVGIVVLWLLLSVYHPGTTATQRPLTPTEWAVITIAVGVVGGMLYHLFLGKERDVDRIFISLAGSIVLVSGAAAYLQLSPLFATMLMGAILVNTSSSREQIVGTLARTERPFYFVLLVFAGARWSPSLSAGWIVIVAIFLVARFVAKVGGARMAARANGELEKLGPNWGWALVGQGGLSLALALNYTSLESPVVPNIVFTAAIASVLLTDVSSARLIHAVVAPRVGAPTATAAAATAAAQVPPGADANTAAAPPGER